MESNSICNNMSNNIIAQLCSRSLICLSQVYLQTELDNTMSLVPFNPNPNPISNYNFQEKKNSQVMKERENLHQNTDKGCDWLI